MIDSKIILLIGRSGKGKSTLANVITNTNNFKESSGSVSETKKVQFEKFENADNKINYAIIDTPGIGDTKMSDSDVLNIIAEAIYLGKDGISQVFFVNDGRFDQYEMATYDLLRTILFDKEITKHTTVVRTRFPEFRNKTEWQADIELMIEEANRKKSELESSIASKKKETGVLTPEDEKYQKLLIEIEKLEKGLKSTNLSEILESCQEKVIYVDNPSLKVKDQDELELNKEDRTDSREILLDHLSKSCQVEPYNPPNLKKLSDEIAEVYFQYLKKKEELQKELEEEARRLRLRANLQKQSFVPQTTSLSQTSSIELTLAEEQTESQENIVIIEKEKLEKIIVELQNKKERLKKEIAEKEKIIHQKVLKHIFNNYEAINKELGGDIFLNSVAGDYPWSKIHPELANKELVIKWLSQGFDYFQTQKWTTALIDFNPQIDADFCAWLRDVKQLTVEEIKRASYPQNIGRWRQEYAIYLGKETELLDKHKDQLEKKDWKEIHEDFAKEEYWGDKTYQQVWEENGLTIKDAQEWIPVGFEPSDYEEVKNWKNHNFTPQEVKSWIDVGLDKEKDIEFMAYLKLKNYQPNSYLNLEQLRAEFQAWKVESKLAREYLDVYYPKSQRNIIKELNIKDKNLTDNLNLSDFINLEELNCAENKLTSLNLDNCLKLKTLYCYNNYLQDLSFLSVLSSEKLTGNLSINSNNFPEQDLSIFSRFVNLERLYVSNTNEEKIKKGIYNRFYGSLGSLQNLSKLESLGISNTDVDSGLEYLPESVEYFWCSANKRKDAKCQVIYNLFANAQGKVEIEKDEYGDECIKNFPQKLQEYQQKLQVKDEIEEILSAENITSEKLNQQLINDKHITNLTHKWQNYLDYAQTLEELSSRRGNILVVVAKLRTEQQAQIVQIEIPPKGNN